MMVTDDKTRAALLGTFMGMVFSMLRMLGISADEAAEIFSRKNIREGYAILDRKTKEDCNG